MNSLLSAFRYGLEIISIYPQNGPSNGGFPIIATGYGFGNDTKIVKAMFTSKSDPLYSEEIKVDTISNMSLVFSAPSSKVDVVLDMEVRYLLIFGNKLLSASQMIRK